MAEPKRITQRSQKKADDNLTEAAIAIVQEDTIMNMIHNGKTIQDTAYKMGVSTGHVRKLLSNILAVHQESMAEHAEYVYNINYLRLERLYNAAVEPVLDAMGKQMIILDNDRKCLQLALNMIKEQNRMSEFQLRYCSPQGIDDKNDPTKPTINVLSQTIIAGDEMFKQAQASMSNDFMDKHKHHLGAPGAGDVTPDEMLVMELSSPQEIYSDSPPSVDNDEVLIDPVLELEEEYNDWIDKLGDTVIGDSGQQTPTTESDKVKEKLEEFKERLSSLTIGDNSGGQ